MSRPIARTLAALVLAAAVATTSTAAFAATPPGEPAFHLVKKRTSTLAGLSPQLQTSAVEKARSRPNAPTLKGNGGTSQAPMSDLEMDLTCNDDWFITWDEDANGHPIMGSFNLHCDGWSVPIG